jgi:hypothetical protein
LTLFVAGFFFAEPVAAERLAFPREAVAFRAELDRFEAATLPRLVLAVGRLEALRLPARDPLFARDFLAFEAMECSPSDVDRGRRSGGRHSKN